MATVIGFLLLLGILVAGLYLHHKVGWVCLLLIFLALCAVGAALGDSGEIRANAKTI